MNPALQSLELSPIHEALLIARGLHPLGLRDLERGKRKNAALDVEWMALGESARTRTMQVYCF
jgi:hypothetical protein